MFNISLSWSPSNMFFTRNLSLVIDSCRAPVFISFFYIFSLFSLSLPTLSPAFKLSCPYNISSLGFFFCFFLNLSIYFTPKSSWLYSRLLLFHNQGDYKFIFLNKNALSLKISTFEHEAFKLSSLPFVNSPVKIPIRLL